VEEGKAEMRDPTNCQKLQAAPVPELKDLHTAPPLAAAAVEKLEMAQKIPEKWNTKNLGWRLGADFVAAASAASLVAPIIAMVDR